MTWSIGTNKPFKKEDGATAIDALALPEYNTSEGSEKLPAVKAALKELVPSIDKPFFSVTANGHKDDYSDYIGLSVSGLSEQFVKDAFPDLVPDDPGGRRPDEVVTEDDPGGRRPDGDGDDTAVATDAAPSPDPGGRRP